MSRLANQRRRLVVKKPKQIGLLAHTLLRSHSVYDVCLNASLDYIRFSHFYKQIEYQL